jgi:hypothetical protein
VLGEVSDMFRRRTRPAVVEGVVLAQWRVAPA